MVDALVIGAGPAGLMAAEELARAGRRVVICEAKPSPARKLLMAGKSGLNITKDEEPEAFLAAYDAAFLHPMLRAFGPREVVIWSRALGQEVFTGTSGRIFPKAMKASPLLRAWLLRLAGMGVELRRSWRWVGHGAEGFRFETPRGAQTLAPQVTVLALGGASWARLGADGAWTSILAEKGVMLAPWKPANMGFTVAWTAHMTRHFGSAIKGAALLTEGTITRGEFVISQRGIEGGGIYAISRALRNGADLHIDLMPGTTAPELEARLAQMRTGESTVNRLRKLGLTPAEVALIMEFGRTLPLVQAIKRLPLRHSGPRPLDEAISVAGGITAAALTEGLELRSLPGVFACGEMLDWEAPTGGYLLTACLATGAWAGKSAAQV